MTSLDNQAKVRRQGTTVAGTSGFLVGIRRGHIVSELSWSLEHLALGVRSVGVFNLFSHSTGFVSGVRDTNKVTPCDTVERVASSADFTVHLVSSADTVHGRSE
jgi:hypothetical protein